MHIIPAPGLVVIDPERLGTPEDRLPAEGREVEDSLYWHRRLRDGDVVLSTAQAAADTKPPAA